MSSPLHLHVVELTVALGNSPCLGPRGPRGGVPAEARAEVVAIARELHGQRISLRKISAALAARGYVTAGGKPYVATAVQAMLR